MARAVFGASGSATELDADEVAELEHELEILVREPATYDAAGARSRIGEAARRHERIDVDHWPHADVRALARALDHSWNLDRAAPASARSDASRASRARRGLVCFEPLTHDRIVTGEAEIFHSHTSPYEASGRAVDLSGRALRVASVEPEAGHQRLNCARISAEAREADP